MQPRLSSNYIAKDDLKFLALPLSGRIAGCSTMPGVAHWIQGFYARRANTLLAPHPQPPISSYSFLQCCRLNFPCCAWEVSACSTPELHTVYLFIMAKFHAAQICWELPV